MVPGSLTTPPCTENVTWYVLKTPIQLSADEIARFARLYPMNARPVQPLNGRDLVGTR
jgi:carbonic anhydrase